MRAIQKLKLPMFYSEARREMDERGLPEYALEAVRGQMVHRAFMAEIEPFTKQIASIMGLAMPSYVRHPDGRIERDGDGLTDEMREIVLQYRTAIAEIQFKYYGEDSILKA